jgi:HD-like signal output (HDOD) protein
MDSIKKKAGEIDISAWAKSAGDEYRKLAERVPKGFLAGQEADAKREAANIALWNNALDKQLYPVVKGKVILKDLVGLNTCPVIESATAAFALAANGTEASLHPLMDLAEKDPGLALQVLQLTNEVRQAKRKDLTTFVEDVRMGVGYLGEKRLSALARAMPRVRESFIYISEEDNWPNYLRFLTATGIIAELACEQMELSNLQNVAFVAGLTHDIGRLLLMSLQPAAFLHIFQYAQQNKVPMWEAEMLHLEVTSRQLAVEFMKDRPFPARIKSVVRWVEKPEVAEQDLDLVSVVAVARHMCRLCKVGFSAESEHRDLLPLQHTQLWNSIRHRIFPSFNVAKFEVMVRNKCREIVTGKPVI